MLPDLNGALLVRTDFTSDAAWQRVCNEALRVNEDRIEPVFRCVLADLWGVDNNLNISNMDWAEFYDATDGSGVFRGF